ncbi:MAG: 1-deoxy-D-xylulose-5-phosphate reductoisomerase, partial [Bacteroidales bacterium]|nr:1-deoxy-D-xylulose-5-phosphate reductoisomerase [Bacteroidales bacterium]
ILNAANEIAVKAFLSGRIRFTDMPDVVEHTIENNAYIASPDLASLEMTDKEARETADNFVKKIQNCR